MHEFCKVIDPNQPICSAKVKKISFNSIKSKKDKGAAGIEPATS